MSKNDALETHVLNLLAGKSTTLPTHWRIRHLVSGNAETGSGATYSTAPAIAVTSSQLTVSGNQLTVNTALETASGPSANETIIRRVLEFSADNFATVLGAYYSKDVADGDDATVTGLAVNAGTIIRVPAGTGFVATED